MHLSSHTSQRIFTTFSSYNLTFTLQILIGVKLIEIIHAFLYYLHLHVGLGPNSNVRKSAKIKFLKSNNVKWVVNSILTPTHYFRSMDMMRVSQHKLS